MSLTSTYVPSDDESFPISTNDDVVYKKGGEVLVGTVVGFIPSSSSNEDAVLGEKRPQSALAVSMHLKVKKWCYVSGLNILPDGSQQCTQLQWQCQCHHGMLLGGESVRAAIFVVASSSIHFAEPILHLHLPNCFSASSPLGLTSFWPSAVSRILFPHGQILILDRKIPFAFVIALHLDSE